MIAPWREKVLLRGERGREKEQFNISCQPGATQRVTKMSRVLMTVIVLYPARAACNLEQIARVKGSAPQNAF
jgi:hypothetical protein